MNYIYKLYIGVCVHVCVYIHELNDLEDFSTGTVLFLLLLFYYPYTCVAKCQHIRG